MNIPFYSFNAGTVSRYALARTDLEKLRLAAELQQNLFPRVMGPAIFRPGTAFISSTLSDADGRTIPFVFSADTKALLELTNSALRILVDDVILTRPEVSAAVTNGTFDTDLTGWTDSDETGATSSWSAGGLLVLAGTGSNYAIRRQEVTVTETGIEHALRVIVTRGPVTFRVGSASDGSDYIATTSLRTGTHSLSFTPSGNFHITVASRERVNRIVTSIEVEAAGAVSIPTPWILADLFSIRYAQSGDVLFCACEGIKQRRIERRSQRSWSVVEYDSNDGPFRFPNTTATTVTPSDTIGNITVTSSRDLFTSDHVGALWRITHSGQTASIELTGEDLFSDHIRVSGPNAEPFGSDSARVVTVDIVGGAFVATITLQRSFGEPGGWVDVDTYTAAGTTEVGDAYDNQIIYYRIGIKAGDYTSGTPTATITFNGGSQDGIVRITGFTDEDEVTAEVVKALGRAEATSIWAEGEWSDERGYPGAVDFHDGRLWWGWQDRVFGSVSDAYESFDDTVEGDAGPILRSVATGPFEGVLWLRSAQRLLAGTASQEVSIRASSFDEPLTPTQFTARAASDRGSANIQAEKIDSRVIFVQRNGKRVYELAFSVEAQDFISRDLTRLAPEICDAGVRSIAVQRQPDTRVWFVLDDGTVAMLTFEPDDEVIAWTTMNTDGLIRDVSVLPGDDEDEVYFLVQRTINSVTKRYHEKLAKLSECVGGSINKNVDCHIIHDGVATTTISGLSHLIGETVVVWSNGVPLITADEALTVNGSGEITLPSTVATAVVGLLYAGRFTSTKLSYGAQAGTAMGQRKRVTSAGLIMADVGWRGVRVGRTQTTTRALGATPQGKTTSTDTHVFTDFDYDGEAFRGDWGTDERFCFSVFSPYPATFLGAVLGIQTNEHLLKPKNDKQD